MSYQIKLTEQQIREGWTLAHSERKQRPYYFNTRMKESKWVEKQVDRKQERARAAEKRRAQLLDPEVLEILDRWGRSGREAESSLNILQSESAWGTNMIGNPENVHIAMKIIVCEGIVALIDIDHKAGIERNEVGRFYEIPNYLADRIVENGGEPKPVLLMHKPKYKIGKINKFKKLERKVNNVKRDVLVAEFEITSPAFIGALQTSAELFIKEVLDEPFISSDGFLMGSRKNGNGATNIDATAKYVLMKKYPELSIGHNRDDSVDEISLCIAGSRACTLITDVSYVEGEIALGDNDDSENTIETYLKLMAGQLQLSNRVHADIVEADLISLGEPMYPLYPFNFSPSNENFKKDKGEQLPIREDSKMVLPLKVDTPEQSYKEGDMGVQEKKEGDGSGNRKNKKRKYVQNSSDSNEDSSEGGRNHSRHRQTHKRNKVMGECDIEVE